jgi:inorganic phosphate transporter, PiT family
LFSPIIGFVLALIVFRSLKFVIHDKRLYEPPEGDKPPVWWMRGLLILTCTGVSFAHGTNDGQKSIGLIMLVIIGLFPTAFAANLDMRNEDIANIAKKMPVATDLIERYGDDQKAVGVAGARKLAETFARVKSAGDIPEAERPAVRNDLDQVLSELKTASEAKGISKEDKGTAKSTHDLTMKLVQYAPWWVRILSALCLGFGTMVGYRRIVTTLGERLGKQKLAPAQGGSAELGAAAVIGVAGFTGFPVSTTHVVTEAFQVRWLDRAPASNRRQHGRSPPRGC